MSRKKKYHISLTGELVVCSASQRACPRQAHFQLSPAEHSSFGLAKQQDSEIVFPSFDLETIAIGSTSKDLTRARKASNPRTIATLANHPLYSVVSVLVLNPATPEESLRRVYNRLLADRERTNALILKDHKVSGLPYSPAKERLKHLHSMELYLLNNKNLPEDIIEDISKHLHVREDFNKVVRHPNVSVSRLEILLKQATEEISLGKMNLNYLAAKVIYENIWNHPRYLHYLIDKDNLDPSFKKLSIEELIILLAPKTVSVSKLR